MRLGLLRLCSTPAVRCQRFRVLVMGRKRLMKGGGPLCRVCGDEVERERWMGYPRRIERAPSVLREVRIGIRCSGLGDGD